MGPWCREEDRRPQCAFATATAVSARGCPRVWTRRRRIGNSSLWRLFTRCGRVGSEDWLSPLVGASCVWVPADATDCCSGLGESLAARQAGSDALSPLVKRNNPCWCVPFDWPSFRLFFLWFSNGQMLNSTTGQSTRRATLSEPGSRRYTGDSASTRRASRA
eukprot:scaffold876_cov243-Pinguiococcus_pyrenoidosus.AAC.36